MSGRVAELVLGPLRSLRRSTLGWGIGIAALIALTVAFWPAFHNSSGISQAIDALPAGVVEAFGLEDFGTPAGFLRGNLYEFLVPLLLAIAAVAAANGLTASEEDSGRLELFLAQPVSRVALFAGRALAVAVWVVVITIVILVVQVASDAVVGLSIDAGRVLATVVLSGLLALAHGALALAVAGWRARPALVVSVGVAVAVAGYLVAALFPLSDVLEPFKAVSPWEWAFGSDPLVHGAEAWRYASLVVPTVVLSVIGLVGFRERDVRAA
jgi:ABC-2 type transport system permease protein